MNKMLTLTTPLLFAAVCAATLAAVWFTGPHLNVLTLLGLNVVTIGAVLLVTRLSGLPGTARHLILGIALFAAFQIALHTILSVGGFASDIARNSAWLASDRIVLKLDEPLSTVAVGTLLYAVLAWRWGWVGSDAQRSPKPPLRSAVTHR